MKKLVHIWTLILLGALGAFAQTQGAAYQSYVIGSNGLPVPGATVRVCTAAGSGSPCSPLASLFSDLALTVPLTNPITADTLGNFKFTVAQGSYLIQITGVGVTQYSYLVTIGSASFVTSNCIASLFPGADLAAQTTNAFATGCTIVQWMGVGTIGTGPVVIGSRQSVWCGAGKYTETGGSGETPNAIEIVNGSVGASFIGLGQSGCEVDNNQTPAYSEVNNVPSATFVVCSTVVTSCDNTAPDFSTLLSGNCAAGASSCSVASPTGFTPGQDVVIGSNRGDSAYQISPTWNGSNPVTFTRPMDDNYTAANGAFLGRFANGFTKDWSITGVKIVGTCAGTAPCVGHGIFVHNAFYGNVQNISAYTLGGRVAVANGYSAFIDYDHIFDNAAQSISPSNNGFEPGYVLTSHIRASNSTVVGAPANGIAFHGYHQQSSNLQSYGNGLSGLQLDTLEDYSDTGSQFHNNATNGINVAGDPGNNYATDVLLTNETVWGNLNDGIGAGTGGNVKIMIRGLIAYNNLGNTSTDGGNVFFNTVEAGSLLSDSIICGGVRGVFVSGAASGNNNTQLIFHGLTFTGTGLCGFNSGSDFAFASGASVSDSDFQGLNFGAAQPISTADCATLQNLNNTMLGLTGLGSQCGESSGIWQMGNNSTISAPGGTFSNMTSLLFAGTGTPALTINGSDSVVVGSPTAGGGTFPLLTVATLPSATAYNGSLFVVSDSTNIAAEGQTCVGSSGTRALAFASGGVWKCF